MTTTTNIWLNVAFMVDQEIAYHVNNMTRQKLHKQKKTQRLLGRVVFRLSDKEWRGFGACAPCIIHPSISPWAQRPYRCPMQSAPPFSTCRDPAPFCCVCEFPLHASSHTSECPLRGSSNRLIVWYPFESCGNGSHPTCVGSVEECADSVFEWKA